MPSQTLKALRKIYTHFTHTDGPRHSWKLFEWTTCTKCGKKMSAPDPVDIHKRREDLEAAGFIFKDLTPDFATWSEERQGLICFFTCQQNIEE